MPYSPNFRQGSFSEAHIHTPAYLYGSGAYESELCSASFRVDSFSETGLPLIRVLGNWASAKFHSRKLRHKGRAGTLRPRPFSFLHFFPRSRLYRVRFYWPLKLSFALSISPLSSSCSLANVSTASTETSTPTKGSSPTIQASCPGSIT